MATKGAYPKGSVTFRGLKRMSGLRRTAGSVGVLSTMRCTNKAKEMKRRASQRRATHKARLAALRLRTEKRMAPIEAGKGKTKVGSKGSVKATVKARKSEKR
jgi:hypothetical protein